MGNKNTKFFDDLSKGATWSAGVAFKRSNPLPLDRYSVFETKALAEAYATSNAVAYPGQVIAVAEGNKMVAYVLAENTAGDALVLQQIGIIPTGDDKTIDVTEDGVISLLAADTEVFKKDAEGNPTEEKEINAGAQLVLQADGTLKWVKPDTTTVEGLSTAVTDLQGRMTTAETDIDALELAIGAASKPESSEGAEDGEEATGIYAVIEAEAARAVAAEKALDDAIKAIDFMDSDEVANAIEEGIKDLATKKYVDDELAKKVNIETYNTDKKALEDEDAAIREIAEGVKARVDAFLDGTGTEAALDSLQELIAYIDEHDGADLTELFATVSTLEGKLEGIDTTVVAYVTAAIEALKIGDYAKAADLTELAGKVTALEGKVDVAKVSEAIAAAEGRAATDAQSKANKALEDAKADTDTKLANYYKKTETYSQTEVNELIKDFATDKEVEDAVAAEAARADKAEKANADAITAIKADATIVTFKGVEEALAGKQATGDYATKTEAKGYADAKDTAISAAQSKADSAYALAEGAQSVAEAAQGTANTNAANIEELDKFLFGREAVEGQDAIVGLNTKVASNTTRIGTLEGTVAGHTTAIGDNATAAANAQAQADEAFRVANLKTTMAEVEAKGYAVAETVNAEIAKKITIAEVEAKGYAVAETVNADLAKKADKETTYSKKDIDGLIAPLATTEALNTVKATADAAAVKADVDAKFEALDAIDADYKTRIEKMETFWNTTAEPDAVVDTLKEIQNYIANDETGASNMLAAIEANEEAIAAETKARTEADAAFETRVAANETAVSETLPAAIAAAEKAAKDHADAEIAKVDTGVMSVTSLHDAIVVENTDGAITINFADEIILNGGGANVAAE